jgi:hypothetical protein
MAKSYTANIATAQRLVTKFGRSVTLVEYDSTLADVAKPWDGPADARTAPDTALVLDAVFVQPGGSSEQLGIASFSEDLLSEMEQILIVSPGAAIDLSTFHAVLDGTTYWKIVRTESLKPGPDLVLGFIGVKR